MSYKLEIRTPIKVWEEEFDPGTRTHNEIIEQVQDFLNKEEHATEIAIHIHMPEDHPAIVE